MVNVLSRMAVVLLGAVCFQAIALAQGAGQPSDGVLVSGAIQDQEAVSATLIHDQDHASHPPAEQQRDNPASPPVDDIVLKATESIVSSMTVNLKLTSDQVDAVTPIIQDNIAKTRALQQSLQHGAIDSKAMIKQRQRLFDEENRKLASVLNRDQMKGWAVMQSDSE
ncbi:MAG: hypothetical protein KGK03_03045 [Candidatus Omnitrophica bacterium]|nr:hypothetical protein [Candidatus Omnitrophota bacterium]MDE2222028.1 hypothetical protein [Candidatus Omnitrophota bacterium]